MLISSYNSMGLTTNSQLDELVFKIRAPKTNVRHEEPIGSNFFSTMYVSSSYEDNEEAQRDEEGESPSPRLCILQSSRMH